MPSQSIEKEWASGKPSEVKLAYGVTFESEPGVFRDLKIFFNQTANKFILTSNPVVVETSKSNDLIKKEEQKRAQSRMSGDGSKENLDEKRQREEYEARSEVEL